MKSFKLTRLIQYSETLEVEAESWDAAKEILLSDAEFERENDDRIIDQNINFLGDIE